MRSHLVELSFCVLTVLSHQTSAINAHVLFAEPYKRPGLRLLHVESGVIDTLSNDRAQGARFSPDGTKICFANNAGTLYLINTDGTGQTPLTTGCSPVRNYLSYTDNGIYWYQEYGTGLKRCVPGVDTVELVHDFGVETQGAFLPKDGRRGVSRDGDFRFELSPSGDAVTNVFHWEHISHGMQISLDGAYAYFLEFKDVSGNPDYQYHRSVAVQEFFTTAIGEDIVTFANFDSMSGDGIKTHWGMQQCDNHNDYLAVETFDAHRYVLNWRTLEMIEIPGVMGQNGSMWLGDLPPVGDYPSIAIDKYSLTFADAASDTVTVTNAGTSTLSPVTVAVSPAAPWLTVSNVVAGDSQLLINTVDTTSLASGTYEATVTVSGGGALNTRSYTVTLSLGSADYGQPTNLASTVTDDTLLSVELSWSDNSTGESGFQVECNDGSGWQVLDTTGADVAHYSHIVDANGAYTYRIQAVGPAGASSLSPELAVVVAGEPKLFVTSQIGGETRQVGDTVVIQWTARQVNVVAIEYSTDEGETWTALNEVGGIGVSDPEWSNFAWVLPPSVGSSTVFFWVHMYQEATIGNYSNAFDVAAVTAVSRTTTGRCLETGITAVLTNGRIQATLSLDHRAQGLVRVLTVHGRVLEQKSARMEAGRTQLHFRGQPGAGVYLMQFVEDGTGRGWICPVTVTP